MSKVDTIQVPDFEGEGPGYEEDFAAWSFEQAQRLRMLRIPGVDVENIAEEIESLGRSDKRALRSHTRVLLMHLLKYRYQDGFAGPSWRNTIRVQREAIEELLDESPSLRPTMGGVVAAIYQSAVRAAAEETGLAGNAFPSECEWTRTQVFDPDFLPETAELG